MLLSSCFWLGEAHHIQKQNPNEIIHGILHSGNRGTFYGGSRNITGGTARSTQGTRLALDRKRR